MKSNAAERYAFAFTATWDSPTPSKTSRGHLSEGLGTGRAVSRHTGL